MENGGWRGEGEQGSRGAREQRGRGDTSHEEMVVYQVAC